MINTEKMFHAKSAKDLFAIYNFKCAHEINFRKERKEINLKNYSLPNYKLLMPYDFNPSIYESNA